MCPPEPASDWIIYSFMFFFEELQGGLVLIFRQSFEQFSVNLSDEIPGGCLARFLTRFEYSVQYYLT